MEKIHTREEAQLLFSGVKDFDNDLVALGNFQESPYFSTPESEKRKWSVEKRKNSACFLSRDFTALTDQ